MLPPTIYITFRRSNPPRNPTCQTSEMQSARVISASKVAISPAKACAAFRPVRQGSALPRFQNVVVRASSSTEKDERKKELVGQIKDSLKASGVGSEQAKVILKQWQEAVGHEITPDDLRKVLVGQSTKALLFIGVSTLLDAGAAYGSFTAGNFLGLASEQYGIAAIIGQAIAYLLAGYYVTGAVFDLFKLGAVAVATVNYNVNSAAFLEAVEGIAGSSGLNVADKAIEAVNSVKILQALSTMSDMLRSNNTANPTASAADMLADLGAYLVLDKAQRAYGFDAEKFGLTDAEATEIALVFSKYDLSKSKNSKRAVGCLRGEGVALLIRTRW